jgi:hypothetical protein
MNIERMAAGQIAISLSRDSDDFVRFAEIARKKLGGKWIAKIDGLDQSYWDLDVQGEKITVHREHYMGVSVLADDVPAKRAMLEILQRDWAPPPRRASWWQFWR